jgi:hypothetical protein
MADGLGDRGGGEREMPDLIEKLPPGGIEGQALP